MDTKTICRLFEQREHYFPLEDRLFMQNYPYLIRPSDMEKDRFKNLTTELGDLDKCSSVRVPYGGSRSFSAGASIGLFENDPHYLYLRNPYIERDLIIYAQNYPVILGGFLLLTSVSFLRFASTRQNAIFIVQNYNIVHEALDAVRQGYASLSNTIRYNQLPMPPKLPKSNRIIAPLNLHGPLLTFEDDEMSPLYHPKYLIFGKMENERFVAQAVALGSYNMTSRAQSSVEHMTIFENSELATDFLHDFVKDLRGSVSWP
jgi:hypothetical protein